MAGATPGGIPYPTGTDRVMDGDNAMQAIADALDPPWTALPLGAGMSATAGAVAPGYRVIGTKFVQLKGGVTKSSAFAPGDIVGTLPAAARPTGSVRLAVAGSRVATTAAAAWRIEIATTGVMTVTNDTSSPSSTLTLDGAQFATA